MMGEPRGMYRCCAKKGTGGLFLKLQASRRSVGNRSLRFLQSSEHAFWQERSFAQPDADSVKNGIGYSRGDRCAGGFAAAESGHLRAIDQDDLNFGNIG